MIDSRFDPKNRKTASFAVVLVLTSLVFVVLRLNEMPVGALVDDAFYVEMARSLAEGRGPVLFLHPLDGPRNADIFPAGFPLLLAPLAKAWPSSLAVLKLVPFLAWLVIGRLAWSVPHAGASVRHRLVLVFLTLANPWTVGHAVRIVSDLPFTALALGGLLAFRNHLEENGRRSQLETAALLMAASAMVRPIGWAGLLAMVLLLALRRSWSGLGRFLLATAAPLLAFELWFGPRGAGLFPPSALAQETGGGLAERLHLVGNNLIGYLAQLPTILFPVFGEPTAKLAAGAGLGAVAAPAGILAGLVLAVVIVRGHQAAFPDRGRDPLRLYLVIYAAVLFNFEGWPSGVQTRLLLPVLPFLLHDLLTGLGRIPFVRPTPRLPAIAAALMVAAVLVHNGYRIGRPPLDPILDPSAGAAWIRSNTGAEETVMVRMPLRQHIHLQRPVVGFGPGEDIAVGAMAEKYDVRWILLGPTPVTGIPLTAEARNFVEAHPGTMKTAHRDPAGRFTVFEVIPAN